MYVAANDSSFLSCIDSRKATKVGAIVGGQTSCKAPELGAFDKHLPADVEIISCHSLHGPNVNPKGQPLVRAYVADILWPRSSDNVLCVRYSSNIELPTRV